MDKEVRGVREFKLWQKEEMTAAKLIWKTTDEDQKEEVEL